MILTLSFSLLLSTEKSGADVEPPCLLLWGKFGQHLLGHLPSTPCSGGRGGNLAVAAAERGSSCLHGGQVHNIEGYLELMASVLSCQAQIILKEEVGLLKQ